MASLKQLNDKIKTFNDFKKVVNIQKVVVMKDISELKKVVNQAKFRNAIFNNLIIDMQKKFNIYDPAVFSTKRNIVPENKDLHFIIGTKGAGSFSKYSGKLILEYIKKNHKPNDINVVVGEELGKLLKRNNLKVLNVMEDKYLGNIILFKNISFQVLSAFQDLMFKKTDLLFLNSVSKKVESYSIFPLNKKKVDLSNFRSQVDESDFKIIKGIKLNSTELQKDLSTVAEHLSALTIEMKIYSFIIEYKLSTKLRELQSLEDKEKNIDEEISKIVLISQRVRKENITNELLTNATAFAALNVEEEEEEL
ncbi:MAG: hypothetical protein GY679_01015 [Mycoplasma sp.]|nr:hypothetical protein [Mycoplasma sp.]